MDVIGGFQVVDEYRYLGIILDKNLSYDRMVTQRRVDARNALMTAAGFLSRRDVPISLRSK